jgi:predicted branched-subunit amino acid permease
MIQKIPRGFMQPVKKGLGVVVGIAGIGMVFGINQITNLIEANKIIFGILLLVVSYFLIISGRQQ